MITEELKELVREEARNLRKKATKEELNRLDFDELQPSSYRGCVYGQMTGDCYSKRANKLIISCCTKVVATSLREPLREFGDKFYSKNTKKEHGNEYHSPIEIYIAKEGANNANLISYLKGETDTLEL